MEMFHEEYTYIDMRKYTIYTHFQSTNIINNLKHILIDSDMLCQKWGDKTEKLDSL